ncbi:type II secretion system protein, partial [Vibrio parahaemolyticus]|nr:type II secretion system protein [Vibrio parahaemolyticus]
QYQQRTIKPPVAVIDEFPTELNDLVTTDEQFWINCSEADEAAKRCIRPDSVPWTRERIGYEAGHKSITIGTELRDVAYAQLTFPLSSSVIEPIYRAKWAT